MLLLKQRAPLGLAAATVCTSSSVNHSVIRALSIAAPVNYSLNRHFSVNKTQPRQAPPQHRNNQYQQRRCLSSPASRSISPNRRLMKMPSSSSCNTSSTGSGHYVHHLQQQQVRWLRLSSRSCHSAPSSPLSSTRPCRIGCASGFWGDTPTAVGQLVRKGRLDYLILDYLSEITMSLLTAAKSKDPKLGYAPDFVLHAVGPHLKEIKKQGIKVISNAGGINPIACAAALRAAAEKAGVDIKVGVVTGDDLLPQLPHLVGSPDMTTGAPLPDTVTSINAYTGAGSIIRALELGADIVVTGRAADSALALAPAAFHHGWELLDLLPLAGASVAGHLVECGAQVTGGNHTDWRRVGGWHDMGFPIASVSSDGSCVITKPPATGGLLSRGTVCEQLLYEVGDPRCYLLPDLGVDFTRVTVGEPQPGEDGELGVLVEGAVGLPATDTYKVGATHLSGFKATGVCCLAGPDSATKGRITAQATLDRTNGLLQEAGLPPITQYLVQVLGAEDTYGPHARSADER